MGSLKRIGTDFGLPVTKGDFPHNFSRRPQLNYRGPMPGLYTPEDYYGLKTKRSHEDQLELQDWHARESQLYCSCVGLAVCTCTKPVWDFQVELERYCLLDNEVLSQAMVKYRAEIQTPLELVSFGWKYKGIDPFANLTQSQCGISVLLNGHEVLPVVACTHYSERADFNPKSNSWLQHISRQDQSHIQYKGTALKEYYEINIMEYVTGYCRESDTIYIFHDCIHDGCRLCLTGNQSEDFHRIGLRKITRLRQHHRNVIEIWEHDWNGENKAVIQDREMFFGGRTEVFSAYAKETARDTINYDDVCSLYPFICAFRQLPLGFPDIYHCDQDELWERHGLIVSPFCPMESRVWGFVKCSMTPNPQCTLGLLPGRDVETGRLQFTVLPQSGVWHTEEIYLAMRNGYTLNQVEQVYHWEQDKRGDQFMKGYISFFLKMKQEAEGWVKAGCTSETPTEEEKDEAVERLFVANGGIGRMDKTLVKKSPVKRQIAKIYLNSSWGKLVQMTVEDFFLCINGYAQFLALQKNENFDPDQMWYRHVKDNFFKVRAKKRIGTVKGSLLYNIFIGASVTAQARCYIHEKMLVVGPERILYMDTDSIIYLRDRALVKAVEMGLGKWIDEHPREVISAFYGLAPKSYNLAFSNGHDHLKTKGITMTCENQDLVTHEVLENMIEGVWKVGYQPQNILLKNMNIGSNCIYTGVPFASMLTFYSEKIMRPRYSKRRLVRNFGEKNLSDIDRIYLMPIGACEDEVTERLLSERFY